MHKANILSILEDTKVAETKLGKALVNQVDWRVGIKSDG